MTANLTLKIKPIQSGAFWFGVVSKLTFIWCAYLVFALTYAYIYTTPEIWEFAAKNNLTTHDAYYQEGFINIIKASILGWLFLKGKDAFLALESLIVEMSEIV